MNIIPSSDPIFNTWYFYVCHLVWNIFKILNSRLSPILWPSSKLLDSLLLDSFPIPIMFYFLSLNAKDLHTSSILWYLYFSWISLANNWRYMLFFYLLLYLHLINFMFIQQVIKLPNGNGLILRFEYDCLCLPCIIPPNLFLAINHIKTITSKDIFSSFCQSDIV